MDSDGSKINADTGRSCVTYSYPFSEIWQIEEKQTLMSIFEQWNTEYAKQVEGGLKGKKTYERYKAVYTLINEIIEKPFIYWDSR